MGAQLQQQQLEHQHQQVHYQQNNPTIQQNVTHVVSNIPQHQESVVYMPIPIRSKTSLTVDALIEKVWNDSWKKIEAINPGKLNHVLPSLLLTLHYYIQQKRTGRHKCCL